MSPSLLPGNLARKPATSLLSAITFVVFLFLDFLEIILCVLYRYVDGFFEGKASPCYCKDRGEEAAGGNVDDEREENEVSETLYGRRNMFTQMGFLGFARKWEDCKKACRTGGDGGLVTRWSDCGCENCVSWMKSGGGKRLHVVVKEPSRVVNGTGGPDSAENVIFLHGFMSSSSFWTETVFQNISEPVDRNYRLFAVDLLGFGRSPKPRHCLYTLKDHLGMIENSVIDPFKLKSFHLVAHSMGCIIALGLAYKHPESVKSITLISLPYSPGAKEGASLIALQRFAGKRLWPPLLFGAAFMSWYEHLGRCVCFLVCRNHRIWEGILKLLTWRRDLHFMIMDATRHTHHSAWHTMHNVVCGGAKYMDDYLEILMKFRVKICIIQGDRDSIVPLECSNNFRRKVPDAEVSVISNANHSSVIIGREKDFTQHLEQIWGSFADTEYCSEDQCNKKSSACFCTS